MFTSYRMFNIVPPQPIVITVHAVGFSAEGITLHTLEDATPSSEAANFSFPLDVLQHHQHPFVST